MQTPPDTDWSPIVEALDVGVVLQTADAVITYANAKAVSLLGLTPEEMLGRSSRDPKWNVIDVDGRLVMDGGHPAISAARFGVPVRDVILGVFRPRSNDRIWITVSAIPELDASGAVCRVVVTFTDVSTQQRAARSSESRYQSVIRSMSEGVVIHNADGSIRMANAAAERVLGMTLDQMQGRSPLDPRWRLTTPDGLPAESTDIPSEITRLSGKAVDGHLLSVHRANGERAWLMVGTDPVREPGSDELTAIVATFSDVTAEREAKLALEASRRQIQRVLDAVPGVVYQFLRPHTGPDQLPFIGGRVQELLGVTSEEIGADPQKFYDLVHPDDLPALLGSLEQSAAAPQPFEIMLRRPWADQSVRWLKAHSIPVEVPEGVLHTGVLLDITEERLMQDVLRRTQRREAMASLAAGIAHNFNNMLAVLLPNLELAMRDVSDEVRTLLADAEQAARRASGLVGQLLTVGRTPADEPVRSSVDLVPLVREALHICRSTFDRGIAIDEEIDADQAWVGGRASHLQQVLLNLCLNARDAMDGLDERRLTVRLSHDAQGAARLTVSDTGSGMTPDTLRHLGEPFFTTKATGAGTGLGLASAFHTISEAGGSWSVTSAPGRGTTFDIRLPLVERPARDAQSPTVTDVVAPQAHVLIVDDEAMVRRALARMLERAGFDVEPVGDGAAAIERITLDRASDARRIDVVLLDLSMPGMPGEAVLHQLVRIDPQLPVIVMSGHVADPGALRSAHAVLGKPVAQADLVATVTDALRAVGHGNPARPRT